MRWPVFTIAAYLAMVLQVGLAPHITLTLPWGTVEPRLVLILAVFIALIATTQTTLIACGVLGLLLDLATTMIVTQLDATGAVASQRAVTLIGPYTLGYMAGGYLIVQMRPLLFRQHPFTFAAMTVVAGIAVHLIVVGILSIRRWYEPMPDFAAFTELTIRVLGLVYTVAVGVVLLFPLRKLTPLFNFTPVKGSRRG